MTIERFTPDDAEFVRAETLAEMRFRVGQIRQDSDTIRRHVLRTTEAA